MKLIVKFVLNSLKIYFFGGLCSLLMLLYLVITDPYFTNLDWKFEKGFEAKLDIFFKLTFYLPIFLMIAYGFLLFLNCIKGPELDKPFCNSKYLFIAMVSSGKYPINLDIKFFFTIGVRKYLFENILNLSDYF